MAWGDDNSNDWHRSKTNAQGHDVNAFGYDKNGTYRGTDDPRRNTDDPKKNFSFGPISGSGSGSGLGFMGLLIGIPLLIAIIVAVLKDARVYIISIAGVIIFFTVLLLLLRRFHARTVLQYAVIALGIASLAITFALLGQYSKLRVYPVRFEYSLIQELEDGAQPQLYQLTSLYKNRKSMGYLVPQQMVTVLGNTKRGQNFKIQTADGRTGFVDPSAILPDISPDVLSAVGSVFKTDRSLNRLQRTALPVSNAMGQKNGQITRIDYGNDYTTLVIINTGKERVFSEDNILQPGAQYAYYVYDLNTSEKYQLKGKGSFYNGVYLVFEPFSSRNFNLIGGGEENYDWHFLNVKVSE